jgi:hypothetical protein
LLPELLGKPIRDGDANEDRAVTGLLGRLDLHAVDRATAELSADRFITNNQRDFPPTISELRVTYPADLPEPGDDPGAPPTVAAAAARSRRPGIA